MRRRVLLAALAVMGCCLSVSRECSAAERARVVAITDGDTLTVLDSKNVQHVIRLAGIDAPESSQPFGQSSKRNLSRLTFDKHVSLDCLHKQSYGRDVCKIMVSDVDVGLEQIRDGLAWHYKQYESEQSASDRQQYAAAEDAARAAHLGLWMDTNPIQPQDWRHHSPSHICVDSRNRRTVCEEQYVGPVRGNRRSGIYQWPGCRDYDSISLSNRVEFADSAAAKAAGYRAAHNCE